MAKICWTFVGLLVLTVSARTFAQSAPSVDGSKSPASLPFVQRQEGQSSQFPPVGDTPQLAPQAAAAPFDGATIPSANATAATTKTGDPSGKNAAATSGQDSNIAAGEATTDGEAITLEGPETPAPVVSLMDFQGYRFDSDSLDWIPGGGNQFGMFSIEWNHYVKAGANDGPGFGASFNFLSGPDNTDMPARTYDFSLGYQVRNRLGPFGFDVSAAVLSASDFIGSARKGLFFPSHAVGFFAVKPELDLVLGVDYVDRGDVKILPVGGMIWVPTPEMRFEVVFPRPRAVFHLTDCWYLYLSGELGGDSWAVWRTSGVNDLATYRDLRLAVGLDHVAKEFGHSSFEIAYLFDRSLKYTSGVGDMRLADAAMLRLVRSF